MNPATEHRLANGLREGYGVLAYDADWQYPAITEQHAWRKVLDLLPKQDRKFLYVGFPWATLIDLLFHRAESVEARELHAVMTLLSKRVPAGRRVITVCQHILMLEFQHLFYEMGITDVFWSHATEAQDRLPHFSHIRIHPFPLFPVQAPGRGDWKSFIARRHLFSFVGAKAKNVGVSAKGVYLTETRNIILAELAAHPAGAVIGREAWHYDKLVYGQQIHKKEPAPDDWGTAEAAEFKAVLAESKFSLCPSGTGPNSIRLWESIAFGAIPVILADTWLPPGDPALWNQAVVFCAEDCHAIRALPTKLEHLAANEREMQRKQEALRQLWQLYGPDCFIHDVIKLVDGKAPSPAPSLSFNDLLVLACSLEQMNDEGMAEAAGVFVLACAARIVQSPRRFLDFLEANEGVKRALHRARLFASAEQLNALQAAASMRNIVLS